MVRISLSEYFACPRWFVVGERHVVKLDFNRMLDVALLACLVDPFVVLPNSLLNHTSLSVILALSFSFAVDPLTLKDLPVRPDILSDSVLFVVVVLPLVSTAILPDVNPFSMHFIF
jgi:hypothetical protein